MKLLKHCAYSALFLLGLSLQLAAQAPAFRSNTADAVKPRLFADLPDSLLLDEARLNAVLAQGMQASAHIQLSPGFVLHGKIVSVARNGDQQLTSVVLKASNRLGAVLSLARMVEGSGKAFYTGRMLSRNHEDAYELVQAAGSYYLVKRSYSELVED